MISDDVEVKLNKLKFKTNKSSKKDGIELTTIEHLDNAQLLYLLSHKDVAFVQNGEDAYV